MLLFLGLNLLMALTFSWWHLGGGTGAVVSLSTCLQEGLGIVKGASPAQPPEETIFFDAMALTPGIKIYCRRHFSATSFERLDFLLTALLEQRGNKGTSLCGSLPSV